MFKNREHFEEELAKGAKELKEQLKENTSRIKQGKRKTEEKADSDSYTLRHMKKLMNKPGISPKMKETLQTAHDKLSKELELKRFRQSGDSKKVDQKIQESRGAKERIAGQIQEHVDTKGVTPIKQTGGTRKLSAAEKSQVEHLTRGIRKLQREGKPQEHVDQLQAAINKIHSPDQTMKPKAIGKQNVPTKRAMGTGEGVMVTDKGYGQALDDQRKLKEAENKVKQETAPQTTILSKPVKKSIEREEWEERLAKSLEYI